mmetsp:Transcript_43287/g.85746  ORF Transcript_43287/g.85746 Transcript_43287/m.85746 type:complete len:241 (+) Transcript_43287:95-817(+)
MACLRQQVKQRLRRRSQGSALTLVTCALLWIGAGNVFTGLSLRSSSRVKSVGPKQVESAVARKAGDGFIALDAVYPAVSAYVGIWTPYFLQAKESGLAPEYILHWGHAAAMGTVLLAMGGYGTFLGWQTRLGNGNDVYLLNLGYKNRDMHPLLMGAALFLFFLGGQGGLVLLATAGKPILASAHSSTAVIGLGLMAVQALLGQTMGSNQTGRTVHAFLGTGTMLVLLVHLYFGLNLGSTF